MTKKNASAAPPAPKAGAKKEDKGEVVYLDWKNKRLLALHPPQPGVMTSFMSDPKKTLSKEEARDLMKFQKAMSVVPGIHPYPLAFWNQCKDNDQVQQLLKKRELEVLTNGMLKLPGDPAAPAQALPRSLAEVDLAVAMQLIEGEVFDNDRLAVWSKSLADRQEQEADTLRKQIDLQVRKNEQAAKALQGA